MTTAPSVDVNEILEHNKGKRHYWAVAFTVKRGGVCYFHSWDEPGAETSIHVFASSNNRDGPPWEVFDNRPGAGPDGHKHYWEVSDVLMLQCIIDEILKSQHEAGLI